jgi:hypothetical protein
LNHFGANTRRIKTISADRKKKTEPQNEAAPAEQNEYASLLTKQLKEMMEGFLKDCAIGGKNEVKDHKSQKDSGIKTLGFIEKTFEIAANNPVFAPQYLDVNLLDGKLREMKDLMPLKDLSVQFAKAVNDAYNHKSNGCYQNAFTYYGALKQAAKYGRVETACGLLNELKPFFKKERKLSESE